MAYRAAEAPHHLFAAQAVPGRTRCRACAAPARASLRRELLCSSAALLLSSSQPFAQAAELDELPLVTRSVFMDVSLCEGGARGSCNEPLGRIVIGLYGDTCPLSVAAFVELCQSGYRGTVWNRLLPGEYIQAGLSGPARLGQVDPPAGWSGRDNPEAVSASALRLRNLRPGTVSLALGSSDGEELPPGAPLTRFRITTGPGPVPRLDGQSIVIGRVTAGLQVVGAISRVPTFAPLSSARAWNAVAAAVGDKRAATARGVWSKPRQTVLITDCGVL